MFEEKVQEITEAMITAFDDYIKGIDFQICDARNEIRKQNNQLEVLEYTRGKAEATRTIMVEHQKAVFRQEEA